MSEIKPKHKDIEHASTVIECKNDSEVFYVLSWCTDMGKEFPSWMWERFNSPICLSVNGSLVGFTKLMDRALYYMLFNEFAIKKDVELAKFKAETNNTQ